MMFDFTLFWVCLYEGYFRQTAANKRENRQKLCPQEKEKSLRSLFMDDAALEIWIFNLHTGKAGRMVLVSPLSLTKYLKNAWTAQNWSEYYLKGYLQIFNFRI